ncbi:hypothetical protein R1flu_007497 [Riccia fluitans]|uniref:Protein farnesyltransferase/geranylgeranyltransferase type-1 subunit alpha n=1 Tax=Riccia fluitans TaxID=41844 RepID=A0ABD1YZ17_9MARC
MTNDNWVPFNERPDWDDIEPVPQDDGPHPVVPISYTEHFREVMDYFRAILAKDERSLRALQLTAEVISLNSANYTVWHFRRLVLEALDYDLEEESIFLETIAEMNYKNYQFWQHRRWVAQKRASVAAPDELKYTEVVFNDDSKNYHAWSHRQWVLLNLGGWEGELEYCSKLLSQDIYNNSAWNQRYFVITKDPSRGGLQAMLESEVQYTLLAIRQAPSNESPWRYLRGLFKDDKLNLLTRNDVITVCLEQLAEEESSVHALNLLLDLMASGLVTGRGGEQCFRKPEGCKVISEGLNQGAASVTPQSHKRYVKGFYGRRCMNVD